MFTQKQIVIRLFVFLLMLWLISSFSLRVVAEEKGPSEQISSSEMLHKEDTSGDSSARPESQKDSANWMDFLFGPILKYSPADEVAPYAILPDTLASWKNFKRNMEEKYGTSIGGFFLSLFGQKPDVSSQVSYRWCPGTVQSVGPALCAGRYNRCTRNPR